MKFKYKTIKLEACNYNQLTMLKKAEKLASQGWVVINSGYYYIQLQLEY